jgi:hypothetical protein
MSLFSRGIVAAMEDEMANQELAIDEAGAESMEADLVEAVDMAADIDSGTNEMEQTVKDADQLERHVEVLTEAEGEGGASPELVEATEIAVEAIYNRLGIYSGTGIPALESFTTKTGRARYTTEAIDGIKKKIVAIWEAVVNAFKKLVNYVKDFFSKMFDANKKMLSRVITLRDKLKSIKGTAKEKISGSGITSVIDEKNIDAFNVGTISESVKMANNILNNTTDLVGGVKSKSEFESAKLVIAAYSDGPDAKASAPDKMVWKVIFEFAGNKVIHCVPKERVSGKDAYEFGAKYSVKTEKVDKSGGGDIDTLKEDQIKKVLDGVETTVKALMEQKSTVAAIQSSMDKVIHSIQSLASSGSKDDEDIGNRSTKARSAVTAIGNGSIKIVTLVGSEVTRSCQAMLTYAERSIGAYSEDNKEDNKK